MAPYAASARDASTSDSGPASACTSTRASACERGAPASHRPSAPACRSPAPGGWLSSVSCALLLASLLPTSVRCDDGWRTGRATFYGYDGGATIHQGSCMYGTLPNHMVSTGMDIAALSDTDAEYAGSCGRCYEVQCNPGSFSDGYGNYLDRNGGCREGASVIVTITDSCPCHYPDNAYSNRRWCCGDMYHIDLSQHAFEKIADIGQGVMGVRYRRVECPGGFHASPRAATWDYAAGTGGN